MAETPDMIATRKAQEAIARAKGTVAAVASPTPTPTPAGTPAKPAPTTPTTANTGAGMNVNRRNSGGNSGGSGGGGNSGSAGAAANPGGFWKNLGILPKIIIILIAGLAINLSFNELSLYIDYRNSEKRNPLERDQIKLDNEKLEFDLKKAKIKKEIAEQTPSPSQASASSSSVSGVTFPCGEDVPRSFVSRVPQEVKRGEKFSVVSSSISCAYASFASSISGANGKGYTLAMDGVGGGYLLYTQKEGVVKVSLEKFINDHNARPVSERSIYIVLDSDGYLTIY